MEIELFNLHFRTYMIYQEAQIIFHGNGWMLMPWGGKCIILVFTKSHNKETFVLLFFAQIMTCHVSVNFLSSPGGNSCHHARHFNTFQQISKYLPCRLHKQPILLLDFWCVITVTKSMIILQTNTWLEGNHDNLVTHIYYLFKCFINFKVFSNRKSEKWNYMIITWWNMIKKIPFARYYILQIAIENVFIFLPLQW